MPLDEAYFIWLYSQVGSVDETDPSKTYWTLLKLLHHKEFTWSIEKDGNRAQDGKDQRNEFLRETGAVVDDPDWMSMPCSVLEMLVALAWKVAFEGGGSQSERFWELINNLGLTECTDAYPPEDMIIKHILDKFLDRDYGVNGAGGLFPLQSHSKSDKDQRKVEIWYQAQGYLLERI